MTTQYVFCLTLYKFDEISNADQILKGLTYTQLVSLPISHTMPR